MQVSCFDPHSPVTNGTIYVGSTRTGWDVVGGVVVLPPSLAGTVTFVGHHATTYFVHVVAVSAELPAEDMFALPMCRSSCLHPFWSPVCLSSHPARATPVTGELPRLGHHRVQAGWPPLLQPAAPRRRLQAAVRVLWCCAHPHHLLQFHRHSVLGPCRRHRGAVDCPDHRRHPTDHLVGERNREGNCYPRPFAGVPSGPRHVHCPAPGAWGLGDGYRCDGACVFVCMRVCWLVRACYFSPVWFCSEVRSLWVSLCVSGRVILRFGACLPTVSPFDPFLRQ